MINREALKSEIAYQESILQEMERQSEEWGNRQARARMWIKNLKMRLQGLDTREDKRRKAK